MYLLEKHAKYIIKEETAMDIANQMKQKGYKYVVHSDKPTDPFDVEFAKSTTDVGDVLNKNKDKNLTVSTIESYKKKKAKKITEEKEKWMDKSIKHKGKLRNDLGLKKGEKIYDAGVDKMSTYAKKNKSNADRVRLAWVMSKRRGTTRSQREIKFWNSVSEKMGWGSGKTESKKLNPVRR